MRGPPVPNMTVSTAETLRLRVLVPMHATNRRILRSQLLVTENVPNMIKHSDQKYLIVHMPRSVKIGSCAGGPDSMGPVHFPSSRVGATGFDSSDCE
ncbi:hypothetical protein N7532_008620 [Penicillium argentinense]|uniref:Uncharacterized protein n=1 Tax=Penicillium argentinense TaxID=1131581 RepID=A0A9W9EXZ5_9EURO|nr:uncharacterized protein N7532_008620 [Penicillium argentinense]KAJ5089936.1 hypothetical protein N7532_008620 [Penicillium argentinense]